MNEKELKNIRFLKIEIARADKLIKDLIREGKGALSYVDLLYETKNNLLLQKANLERAINEIEDAEIRLILKLKFIDLKSWSYIGKIMNYERSTVFKKYKKYLQGERK